MLKKILFVAALMLFPFGASASCDLSVDNFRFMSQRFLDKLYSNNTLGIKKPYLIISDRNVKTYYAEERKGVITIYPKSFNDAYCDPYFDGLSPKVAEVISHEYTHYIDEELKLTKKIGANDMEDTAYVGEHIFDNLLWHTGYAEKPLSKSDVKKYQKFIRVLEKARPVVQ